MIDIEDPNGPPEGDPGKEIRDVVRKAARWAFSKQDPTNKIDPIDEPEPDAGIRLVVDRVQNPANEISLAQAREMAGGEVELGDVLVLPITKQKPND